METVGSVEELIRTITQQVLEAIMEAEREVIHPMKVPVKPSWGPRDGTY